MIMTANDWVRSPVRSGLSIEHLLRALGKPFIRKSTVRFTLGLRRLLDPQLEVSHRRVVPAAELDPLEFLARLVKLAQCQPVFRCSYMHGMLQSKRSSASLLFCHGANRAQRWLLSPATLAYRNTTEKSGVCLP